MPIKSFKMKKFAYHVVSILIFISSSAQKINYNLIIGTYTKSCDSKGIYVYDFNSQTGDFTFKNATDKVFNPSYLTLSSNKKGIYSVNENGAESTVSAFDYNSKNGSLKLINKQDSKGADPCFILEDKKNCIVANYSGGTISVFGKNKNGSLTPSKQVIQHHGKSINTKRQQSAHVHMVQFTPDKKYVLANDLGVDKVYIYKYNPNAKANILAIKDSITVKLGSGPRHLTFSNDGKYMYLMLELDGTVSAYKYENESFKLIQETSVVGKDFIGDTSAADIHISPDGNFLYATNRGTANDITCFEISNDGKLKWIEIVSTLGKGPRNFAIDPTGNFLLVAHQYTNTVVVFKINKVTGKLTDTGKKLELCSPVCLVFEK